METGQIGLNGVLVVLRVGVEINHTREPVLILHQEMVAKTAVPLTLNPHHNLAIYSYVRSVTYFILLLLFFNESHSVKTITRL